ncbi:MAG TPA: hypothetical protein VGE34_01790 [Candidatus Saccharimonadales bacterium]
MKSFTENYEKFKQSVISIRNGEADAAFVGEGAESEVWRVQVDRSDYAVKLIKPLSLRGRRRDVQKAVQEKVDTASRAEGIAGLEQLQAASVEEGVVVYEFAKGLSLARKSIRSVSKVPQSQLVALVDTVSQASRVGIEFDGWNRTGDNVFYETEKGFTLIDYWLSGRPIDAERNLSYVVKSLGSSSMLGDELYKILENRSKLKPNLANAE